MKLIFLLIFAVSVNALAQPGAAFKDAVKRIAAEQLHVHTDKQAYVAGETIYFKGYVISGLYPSTYSSSFFIQLVGDSSTIIKKAFPLVSGVAVGAFQLPTDLPEGRYYITAHTNKSIKESESADFISSLFVYNPLSGTSLRPVTYQPKPFIALHYSQKALVAGVINQFFISILDQYHQPVVAKGQLTDEAGKIIAGFNTNTAGAVGLSFVPEAGKKYFVEIDSNVQKIKKGLAGVEEEGAVMNIEKDGEAYSITVHKTPNFTSQKLYLFAEHQNTVLLNSELNLQAGGRKIKLPINGIPSGVIRFTLLTEKDSAIAERFIFSNNTEGLAKTQPQLNKKFEGDKKLFVLQFSEVTEGTTSIQISDPETSLPGHGKHENIINRFLFSSFLKEPFAYAEGLISNLDQTDVSLVNSILATHKLTKPDWAFIYLYSKEKEVINDTDYIRIEGIATPAAKKVSLKESSLNIILRTADSSQAMFSVPLDEMGLFSLKGLMFTDSMSLFYQLNSKKTVEKRVDIKLTAHTLMDMAVFANNEREWKNYFVPFGKGQITEQDKSIVQQVYSAYADSFNKREMLSEVIVQSVRTRRDEEVAIEKRYVSGMFNSANSRTLNFLTDPVTDGSMNLLAYLRRIYSQRFMVSDGGVFSFNSLLGKREYAYFYDQSPATFNDVKYISMNDIAIIKIFQNNFAGAEGNGPAIAIFTRKSGDIKTNDRSSAIRALTMAGYTAAADYPLPKEESKTKQPKYFSGFYWNPYLLIDSDIKRITVPFYNVNQSAKARIIVEGFSSDGRIIYSDGEVELK